MGSPSLLRGSSWWSSDDFIFEKSKNKVKMYLQWAKDPPEAPFEMDTSNWFRLPDKGPISVDRTPIYSGEEVIGFNNDVTIDSTPGWVKAIQVFGVQFDVDKVCMEE